MTPETNSLANRLAKHELSGPAWSQIRLAVLDAARHGEVLSASQVEGLAMLLAAIHRAQWLAEKNAA